jgi:RNA polymerase sigma-70 factor (ECF subfamily)
MTDTLDAVFRREAGRCTATLIRVLGDIDLAEDAVADAFAIAAEQWPKRGIPPNPGGWLTTTARNRAIDRLRRESTRVERYIAAHQMHTHDADPTPTRKTRPLTASTMSSPTTSSGSCFSAAIPRSRPTPRSR